MEIQLYSYTNIGSRKDNEDSILTYKNDDYCLAALCDGLGGHGGGDIASQTALECFENTVKENAVFSDVEIKQLIENANKAVVEKQKTDPLLVNMRTTLAGCVINKGLLKCFNVGDSRVYYFKNGRLKYISKDHSVPQMSIDLKQESFGSLRFNADRNRLTKVLGNVDLPNLVSELPIFKIDPGDAFLICSDGFWEYVYETEMEIDWAKSFTVSEWVEFMLVRMMLRMSNDNDNYSLIAGSIE